MPRYSPPNSHACLGLSAEGVWDALARPVANLPAPVEPGDAATKLYVDAALAGAVVTGFWRFASTLTMADPGTGRVRFNAATPAQTTALALSVVSDGGTDFTSLILTHLVAGDRLAAQDQNDAAQWARFDVSGPPVNNTTWFQIPVTYVAGAGALLVNNQTLLLAFARTLLTHLLAP